MFYICVTKANNMKLSKEQIKIAKKFFKDNGLNPKDVRSELGQGFWLDECKGTFEGYLNYKKNDKRDGSILGQLMADGLRKSPVQKMYNEIKETTFFN